MLALLDDAVVSFRAHGAAPLFGLSDDEVCLAISLRGQLARLLDVVDLRLVRELDGRDLAAREGATSAADLLRGHLLLHPGEAKARVEAAKALDGPLAATGAAFTAGNLSFDHVKVIMSMVGQLDPEVPAEVRAEVEAALIAQGAVLDPAQLRIYGRSLLARVNPDPDDDEDQRRARQTLSPRERDDGMTDLRGLLAPEGAALVAAALDPLAAPRPGIEGEPDPRTPGRRRADALLELCERTLTVGNLPATGGVRPHLSVLIPWETIKREGLLPGETLPTGQPLPRTVLDRLLCDAEVRRIVLDPLGQPLDVGRTRRTATAAIRAAVIARDKMCTFPTCTRPADWTYVHHLVHWTQGGNTALDNSALVCGAHHDLLHHTGYTIRLGPTGRIEWQAPPWTHPHSTWRSNPNATARDPYAKDHTAAATSPNPPASGPDP